MNLKYCSFLIFLLLCTSIEKQAAAGDWLTYQFNNQRNAATDESLDPTKLALTWSWKSAHPPQPAWAGPAKWDAYAGLRGLKSMRNYDPVFHTISVKGKIYFASSVDDSLYCLDAKTGKKLWRFTTDAPIHTTPSFYNEHLYFGSDDGYAYCLKAADGSLAWKFRPVIPKTLILNNGHMIGFWPIRTSVVVDNGVAYFAASLLPWKKSYLCAVNAETGKPQGAGCYVKDFTKFPTANKKGMLGTTLEGPIAISASQLIVPQGRVSPIVFNRKDGKMKGSLPGGGGSFVVITPGAKIFHGPGNKTGWITSSNAKTLAKVASYPKGNAMVISGGRSYILTDKSLMASDIIKRKRLWRIDCDFPLSLVLAGKVLYAGGENKIAAFDAETGAIIRTWKVKGRVFGITIANGQMIASTDVGNLYAFSKTERAIVEKPIDKKKELKDQSKTVSKEKPKVPVSNIKKVNDKSLHSRYVFHRSMIKKNQVVDLAGTLNFMLTGPVKIAQIGSREALVFDGKQPTAIVKSDHNQAKLPKKHFTAEAWVRIDKPSSWGGIVGAMQDNGNYERGWILGYVNNHFSFAVNGKAGENKLTYLKAPKSFELKRWYHVAGSYNGEVMKIYVDGKLVSTSQAQQGEINYPPKTYFEIGAYHDKDENFKLQGQIHEVRLYNRVIDEKALVKRYQSKARDFTNEKEKEKIELALGPWLQFSSRNTVEVYWHTKKPSPSILEFEDNGRIITFKDEELKTKHHRACEIADNNHSYNYRIKTIVDGKEHTTKYFICDTYFNYTPLSNPYHNVIRLPTIIFPLYRTPERDKYCDLLLSTMKKYTVKKHTIKIEESKYIHDRGICLIIGDDEDMLADYFAHELVKATDYRIIIVKKNLKEVRASRKMFLEPGLYGNRITVHHVTDYNKIPFTRHFANLLIVPQLLQGKKSPLKVDELVRFLKPGGGILYLGKNDAARQKIVKQIVAGVKNKNTLQVKSVTDKNTETCYMVRQKLPGAGSWTGLYGNAANTAFGGETLSGANKMTDLQVQWIGRPGPRYQPDRNGRKPSPLSAGGRLFLQGQNRMIALDAHNGAILWSLELPQLQRFNMPRDCSNWFVDENYIYAAMQDRCWQIDARNGKLIAAHGINKSKDLLPNQNQWQWDWGYLAIEGDQILGSSVKQGTAWVNFWGNANSGWYDSKSGPVTHKVCSDSLFALDKTTHQPKWTYHDGVILNSTITTKDGKIYFVESRHPKIKQLKIRRHGEKELWELQFLVAIDAKTGKKLWEKSIDTVDGEVMFQMAIGNNKLTIVGSAQKKYHIYVYDAKDGKDLWKANTPWPSDNHGGHMSRPAIVENRLYVRPKVFNLTSGKPLKNMPQGSCGSYACTSHAIFYRAGNVTVWDQKSGKATSWERLRPDCWISTIPACGMLLSPEGGGGCSCGKWLETSIGFIPRKLLTTPQKNSTKTPLKIPLKLKK